MCPANYVTGGTICKAVETAVYVNHGRDLNRGKESKGKGKESAYFKVQLPVSPDMSGDSGNYHFKSTFSIPGYEKGGYEEKRPSLIH